jgi:uncharacterized protein with ParB-like and HNH nuclease domain
MSSIKHVENKNFAQLLASHRKFSIPAYQRPYSWQPKNISTFWDNIITSPLHYYIGTLVVIPTLDNIGLEIIDGQQRITTLMLFYIALRDFLTKDKRFSLTQDKIKGAEKYLWDSEDFGPSRESRLKFHKKNLSSIFDTLLNGEELPNEENIDDNQRKFVKNYNLLKKHIKDYFKDASDPEAVFTELTSRISDLEFIVIICNSDSDAFQLFEGLNSTGLDLTVVDLLKMQF